MYIYLSDSLCISFQLLGVNNYVSSLASFSFLAFLDVVYSSDSLELDTLELDARFPAFTAVSLVVGYFQIHGSHIRTTTFCWTI